MKIMTISIIIMLSTMLSQSTLASVPSIQNYKDGNLTKIVVVTNKETPIERLERKDVVNIYMGKYFSFGDGESALALDLSENTELKSDFYKRLTGLSLARVNAYWSRIKFTGRARPPKSFRELDDIKKEVTISRGAFAYMPESEVTDSMKVIFRFD